MRFLLMLLAACGDPSKTDTATDEPTVPSPTTDTAFTEAGPCDGAIVEAFPSWTATTSAGLYTIAILSADPATPVSGLNTWTISVIDATGASVTTGTVVLTPFMSVHGHGTSPPTYEAGIPAAGELALGPFDLIMPGPWEFTFEVEADAGTDSVVGTFCAEG